jgi:hypothetical protein
MTKSWNARIIVVGLVLLAVGIVAGWQLATSIHGGTSMTVHASAAELRDAQAAARDAGWNEGRAQGRSEEQFLAQYAQLRAKARSEAVSASLPRG